MSTAQVVVPCYNEEARLPAGLFRAFADRTPGVDFLFVDDGSADGTARRLEELCAGAPFRLRMMRLARNRGKAEAVRQGILKAAELNPSYVGYWDADLSTPLEALPEFIRTLDERPVLAGVLGSRVKLLGRRIERRPLRHYLGRVFATAADSVLRAGVYDTQCGAKLFRNTREVLGLFAEPFLARWLFDVEILARLARSRRRSGDMTPLGDILQELPLAQWRHAPGSKVAWTDGLRAAADLLRIRLRYR
jgi:glycosyltransferase involved in cell wall biosynthesis